MATEVGTMSQPAATRGYPRNSVQYTPTIVSTAAIYKSISPRVIRLKTYTREPRTCFRWSSRLRPDPNQAARASGKATQRATQPTKAFEDHPPHRRYHENAKSIEMIQATKVVMASQSSRIRTGCGGRSGRKKHNTSTVAINETGT